MPVVLTKVSPGQVRREQRGGAFERAEQRDGGGQPEDMGGTQSFTGARSEGESRSADQMCDRASVQLNAGQHGVTTGRSLYVHSV